MLQRILRTDNHPGLLLIRVALGVVMFPHGAQKMLGWFGGGGFDRTMTFFQNSLHVPAAIAFLAIAAEFFGAMGLVSGFLTRIAAFGIAVNMLVAIFAVAGPNGFFMNWNGKQSGEGIEYHILVLGITLALMLRGGGALSVDRALSAKN